MPPKQKVKRSFNVELEAIAILKAYADAAHQGNQTEALNAIILASAATPTYNATTQVPPTIATHDSQANWQKAIEARLTKLEQCSTKPIQDKPQFYEGQEITGQSAKTYRLLWNSFEVKQKIAGAEFHLSNKLGIVCIVSGSSKAGKKKLKVVDCFQGKKIVINDDGTFLFRNNEGELDCTYQELEPTIAEPTSSVEPTNNETPKEVVSHPLEQPISAVELSSDEIDLEATTAVQTPLDEAVTTTAVIDSANSLPPTDATQVPPIALSTEELLARFATKPLAPSNTKTLRCNLSTIKMVKLQDGWTAQHDPDGIAWLPENESREYWIAQPAIAI